MPSTLFYSRQSVNLLAIAAIAWSTQAQAAFYVSNGGDGTIKIVSSTGNVSTYASGLTTPRGLAFDAANNLYVVNNGDSSIRKITPGGTMTTFASGLTGKDLYGIAIDSTSGNIFVSASDLNNTANSAVLQFTPTGTMTTFANVLAPGGLVFDNNHNLFVTSATSGPLGEATGGINEISPLGLVTPIVTSGIADPIGLARSTAGDLYAPEFAGAHRIVKSTTGGSLSNFATGIGVPYGAVFGPDGNLYVADFAGGQLDAITPLGAVSTFATSFTSPRFVTIGPDAVTSVPEPASLMLLLPITAILLKNRRTA